MKQFQQRMITNLIRDVQQTLKEDKDRWTWTFQTIENFDKSSTVENADLLTLCKGSRSPIQIAEKVKFGLLAEDYLRKKLQLLLVDDLSVDEQADIQHEVWKKFQTMSKVDHVKATELQAKFQVATKFEKLGDNDYMVSN